MFLHPLTVFTSIFHLKHLIPMHFQYFRPYTSIYKYLCLCVYVYACVCAKEQTIKMALKSKRKIKQTK